MAVTLSDGNSNVLEGMRQDDFIFGFDDDDIVIGKGGHDRIYGSDDHDRLFGATGNDDLFGAATAIASGVEPARTNWRVRAATTA